MLKEQNSLPRREDAFYLQAKISEEFLTKEKKRSDF